MRILHISKNSTGGAGLAAYRLHSGLLKKHQNSIWFFENGVSKSKYEIQFIPPMDISSRLSRFRRQLKIKKRFLKYRNKRPKGYDIFTDNYSGYGNSVIAQLPNADVLALHAFYGFIDLPASFLKLSKKYPIVWRCPDMNSFTGGCHYDEGCYGWLNRCGSCPQIGSTDRNDLSRKIWGEKRNIYMKIGDQRLHLVAQSAWMAKLIKQSPLLRKFNVNIIPNGVDSSVFFPTEKNYAKKVLGLPENKKIILFVSTGLNAKRKGFRFLLTALKCIKKRNSIMLITVGEKPLQNNIPVDTRHFNYINQDWSLSLIYNAADCFIAPYFQDNCPNTVLEAMSCATPVIAFDSSGLNDLILHNKTGVFSQTGNRDQMADTIDNLLFDEKFTEQIGKRAREAILEKYTRTQQVERYHRLFKNVAELQK